MSVGTWESHHDITTLLYTYTEYIDAADFDAIGELFEHGKITTRGWRARPRGVTRSGTSTRTRTRCTRTARCAPRHLCTNVIVDIDESAGTATARSSFLVLQATKELPLQPIVAGRYRDRFERAAGKWRFAEREMSVEQVGDVREHLTFDLAAFIDR